MSNYYYRVDALRNDGRAGDTLFVRGANFEEAREAARVVNPDLRGDWTLTPVKVKQEDVPTPWWDCPELVIPEDLVPEAVEDYIRQALVAQQEAGINPPRMRTRFPDDVVNDETDTRDTVSLGRHGEVVVVDTGDN